MHRHLFELLVVLTALIAVGCGGGVGGVAPPPPPAVGSISGLISDTRGGPAAAGAAVVIEGTALTTTTDGNGAFAFSGLSPGTYNLLATLAGYGASRLQGITVSGGSTTDIRFQMRRAFDQTKPIAAPTIAVSGLTPGATVSGTVAFTISVAAANPVRLIQVRAGQRGDIGFEIPDSSSTGITFNSSLIANGASFVNVIAYDNNYNLAEWTIPVTVSNAPSGGVPGTPTSTFATAVTFGRPVNVFRAQREAMARSGRLRGDPARLPLRQGRFLDIQSAPADSTLFVYVLWSPVAGATGYKIYRSFSTGGPFILLGDASSGTSPECASFAFSGMTRCHRDSSPDLVVGTSVFYRVTAYTTAGESPQSAIANTTPLAVFNLNLASPADEAVGIPPGGIGTQTFSWAPVATVGTLRHIEGLVAGVNDVPGIWWSFCVNDAVTVTYGAGTCAGFPAAQPLQRAKLYEWDVEYAYAYTAYSAGDAYSMAGFPGFGASPPLSSGSLNGPFRFTTAP